MMNDEIINLVAKELRANLYIPNNTRIDLNYIIGKLGIRFRRAYLGKNVLGACKTIGLKKLIVISDDITYIGQERLTLAHEIGHILLHHNFNICKKEDFYLWRFTKGKEYEANHFAVELLMPETEIQKHLSKLDISFEVIEQISNFYQTSLTSAAIRCTKIYTDSAIIILHKNQKVLWAIKSSECKYDISSKVIDIGTLSSNLNSTNILIKGFVEPYLWVDINDSDNVQCYEETMYFKNLESYLTILKFIEI